MTNPSSFTTNVAIWFMAEWLNTQFQQLNRKVDAIMVDQEKLDADVAALNTALGAIGDEITNLKAQPAAAALDFTGLDAAVNTAQGLAPTATPTPAPADTGTPAAPVDAPTPPSQ